MYLCDLIIPRISEVSSVSTQALANYNTAVIALDDLQAVGEATVMNGFDLEQFF